MEGGVTDWPCAPPAGGALLAIDQGFMGPNYSISTACATANYAFVSGVQLGCAELPLAVPSALCTLSHKALC